MGKVGNTEKLTEEISRNRARNGMIEKRTDSERRGGRKIARDKVRSRQRGSAGAARYR